MESSGLGSPPRVRVKPLTVPRVSPPSRITPARAGKTQPKVTFTADGGDHPRACG